MDIRVDDRELKLFLGKLKGKLENEKLLSVAAVQAQSDMEKHFIDEKDSNGSKWKPLSEYTLSQRKKKGRGAKILRDTGEGSRMDFKVSKAKAKVGSTKKYMQQHNEGFQTRLGNRVVDVAKREWAYISKDGIERIKKAITGYFKL